MTGGDRFTVDMAAGEGAQPRSPALRRPEKIYRSSGADAELNVTPHAGSRCAAAPGCRRKLFCSTGRGSTRRIDIDLAGDATLIMAEAVVFGRAAMGEALVEGSLLDRWRVRRAGELIYADTARLDGAIADKMAQRAVAKAALPSATVLLAPGTDAALEQVARSAKLSQARLAFRLWNGLAVVRLCAKDGAMSAPRSDCRVLHRARHAGAAALAAVISLRDRR